MKAVAIGIAALAVLAPGSLVAGTIYLQDNFSNGSRTDQALPNSAAWFASAEGSELTVVADQFQLNTANGNSGTLAYFSPSTVSLAVGDSIEVSFDFILTGTLASQDRAFGVFFYDSGGSRLTADDTSGFNSPLFADYTGYGITYDPDSTNPARYRTVERDMALNNLFVSTANVPVGSAAASAILTPGQTYTGSLTVTRNASSISIIGNINGSIIDNVDPSSSFTQFDTVAFFAASADIPELTLDDIEVSETSATPEPGTCMFMGIGCLLLLALKNFQKPGARRS